MQFPFLRRKWMKEYIGTATTSILVNGSPAKEFPLERGLRQSDHFSPFFVLVSCLRFACHDGRHGCEQYFFSCYQVGRNDPIIIFHL